MSSSPQAFRAALYQEHLEEAAFLFEQRALLLVDESISWQQVADFEARLEAHLDALVVGGTQALNFCRQRLAAGETGELFAAVCVICRHQDARLLGEVWHALDFKDADRVKAVQCALNWELPGAWEDACARAIARPDSPIFPLLAAVCGYRRIALGDEIAAALLSRSPPAADAVWALSRLPLTQATHRAAEHCFQSGIASVQAAAALTLLRVEKNVQRLTSGAAAAADWSQLMLGLAGDRSSSAVLRQRLESGTATAATAYALGLLGDLSAVRALCAALGNEEIARPVAWALYWITGAPLFATTLEPEAVAEEELFPAELRVWREHGEAPKRADGEPFGAVIRQLSCDASVWNHWLRDHAAQFQAQVRYRRGRPYSPRRVLEGLLDPATPYALRSLAYEELLIRHDCPVAFEADWRVADQLAALEALSRWLDGNETRFQPGSW